MMPRSEGSALPGVSRNLSIGFKDDSNSRLLSPIASWVTIRCMLERVVGEDNELDAIYDKLRAIVEFDPQSIVRKEELGLLNLEGAVAPLTRCQKLFRDLAMADLSPLPPNARQAVQESCEEFSRLLTGLQRFSVDETGDNPATRRGNMVEKLRLAYGKHFDKLHMYIAFCATSNENLRRLEREAAESSISAQKQASSMILKLQDETDSARAITEELRGMAKEAGVSQHAGYFKSEADAHAGAASKWLGGTIAMGVVTLGVSIGFLWLYWQLGKDLDTAKAVQFTVSKVLVLSVLLTSTIWASRIYRAHQHNQVVNRHRQHALSTFKTFAEASGSASIRDAVLLQATQCIFSPQSTGYIQSEPESDGPSKILEIVRETAKPH